MNLKYLPKLPKLPYVSHATYAFSFENIHIIGKDGGNKHSYVFFMGLKIGTSFLEGVWYRITNTDTLWPSSSTSGMCPKDIV